MRCDETRRVETRRVDQIRSDQVRSDRLSIKFCDNQPKAHIQQLNLDEGRSGEPTFEDDFDLVFVEARFAFRERSRRVVLQLRRPIAFIEAFFRAACRGCFGVRSILGTYRRRFRFCGCRFLADGRFLPLIPVLCLT